MPALVECFLATRRLSIGLAATSEHYRAMDDIDRELISLLCTKIGMLMEDHCTGALVLASRSADQQRAIAAELVEVSGNIVTLVRAAQLVGE